MLVVKRHQSFPANKRFELENMSPSDVLALDNLTLPLQRIICRPLAAVTIRCVGLWHLDTLPLEDDMQAPGKSRQFKNWVSSADLFCAFVLKSSVSLSVIQTVTTRLSESLCVTIFKCHLKTRSEGLFQHLTWSTWQKTLNKQLSHKISQNNTSITQYQEQHFGNLLVLANNAIVSSAETRRVGKTLSSSTARYSLLVQQHLFSCSQQNTQTQSMAIADSKNKKKGKQKEDVIDKTRRSKAPDKSKKRYSQKAWEESASARHLCQGNSWQLARKTQVGL